MTTEHEISNMSAEEVAFAEIIGDLVEQWGFKRHLGRIWSLLYLRKDALSPRQIQNELSLSAGNVNLLLGELQTWAVVKRIRVPGDRNFYFEAQTHIWKSIANVLQTRELRILDEAIGGLRKLGQILEKHPKKEIASFQLKRIQHVQSVIETASVLSSLLVNSPPERLNKIGKLIGRLRNM